MAKTISTFYKIDDIEHLCSFSSGTKGPKYIVDVAQRMSSAPSGDWEMQPSHHEIRSVDKMGEEA